VLHCHDIVAHLLGVVRILSTKHRTGLIAKQLRYISLGPLDSRTQNGLKSKLRANQEVRVRQETTDSAESVNSPGSFVQQLHGGW